MVRAVPNVLTGLRLAAVPALVACLVIDAGAEDQWRLAAWWLFGLAAATDWVDGFLARRWAAVSSFGKLADPLADKALVLGALVVITVAGEVHWWPLVLLVVRELGVTFGRLAVARDVVIPASRGGKLKTLLQVAALLVLLFPGAPAAVDAVGWWLLVASTVVAVVTGIDYARRIDAVVRGARPAVAIADPHVPAEQAGHAG